MEIRSSAFLNNQNIPQKYTCDGDDLSPPLELSGAPKGTKSFVLIVDDPDAPVAGGWVHWTMWNIPADTVLISENEIAKNAVEGKTSFGKPGYGGPCPPSGTHRYFFKIYALDDLLALSPSAGRDEVEKAMDGHILGKGELLGLYKRI